MADPLSPHEPETEGGNASAQDGQVMLDGLDGTAITMSPEAAISTAHSLLEAAEEASDQRSAEGHPS